MTSPAVQPTPKTRSRQSSGARTGFSLALDDEHLQIPGQPQQLASDELDGLVIVRLQSRRHVNSAG